jgi:hypothetical protein
MFSIETADLGTLEWMLTPRQASHVALASVPALIGRQPKRKRQYG